MVPTTPQQTNALGAQSAVANLHNTTQTGTVVPIESNHGRDATIESHVSSSAAPDMEKYRARDVAPFLRKDIRHTENVPVENFILSIVEDLYETEDPLPILRRILRCTTEIANGKTPPCKEGGEQTVAEKISLISSNLQSYCTVTGETDRYGPLVESCNAGLSVLQHVKVEGTKDLDTNDMYFLRHDPTEIIGHRKGTEKTSNRRKPDIICASRAAVKQVISKSDKLPKHIDKHDFNLDKLAPDPTPVFIPWEDVRLSAELKKKMKAFLAQLAALESASYTEPIAIEGAEASSVDELEAMMDEFERKCSRSTTESAASCSVQADVSQSTKGPRQRKRVRKSAPDRATKHVKLDIEDLAHPVVQVFSYGAEMLNAAFERVHAMNWLITDTVLHLWYFDREGPIQTSGFDFILQLPYFLAFLYLLQRFQDKHWGFIPQLRSDGSCIRYPTPDKDGEESIFSLEGPEMHTYTYGLGGRCTRTKVGTYMDDERQRRGILKLSSPEISRKSEPSIIEEAVKRCQDSESDDQKTLACLPEVVHWQDFDDFDTSRIRKRLGLSLVDKRARTARAIFLVWYDPITDLTSDWNEFLSVFWDLLFAHATLWLLGIEHGDISINNLYYERKADGSAQAKLCDYDLSHITGEERPAGHSNTGTRIFMAKELLTRYSMNGNTTRVFRHDCESFAWVLIWVLGRYNEGGMIEAPHFDDWKDTDYTKVSDARESFRDEYDGQCFSLRNTSLPNGLFADAFTFLDDLIKITSDIKHLQAKWRKKTDSKDSHKKLAGVRKELAGLGGELAYLGEKLAESDKDPADLEKELADLEKEMANLNTLAYTTKVILEQRLFMLHGGVKPWGGFEALRKLVQEKA
ncbi:hypothetical protein PQX77_018800 [Marasmius sp. AFHP31]|nr:hypothetical protein PQX77_018800 [Marasmius sp. AFHP31]